MKEKLVENWLTKTSERGYQAPLCSILNVEGYSVIHSTRHCAMEMGKDIIARDQSNNLVCFQLKALKGKRLTLSEWRSDLQQQIFPLVMGKVIHPGCEDKIHKSIIVVTGYIDEEVSQEIEQFNKGQIDAGYPNRTVMVWALGDLSSLFTKHLNKLGPQEPADAKRWLELFLDGGGGIPNKDSFYLLCESLIEVTKVKTASDAKAFIAHLMIVTGSIASQYTDENNYLAEIELWTAAYLQILFIQETFKISAKDREIDRTIVLQILRDLLERFFVEVKTRGRFSDFDELHHQFEEQFSSQTACVLAIHTLFEREIQKISDKDLSEKLDLLEKAVESAKLAGEVSATYLFVADFVLFKYGRGKKALTHIYSLLSNILHANQTGRLPSPYYDIETILLFILGEDLESNIQSDNFERSSFTARALLMFLVCNNERVAIDSLWKKYTYFRLEEYEPDISLDLLKRRSLCGTNWSIVPKSTQSWNELRTEATILGKGTGLPNELMNQQIETLLLLFSQPFRLTAQISCNLYQSINLKNE